MRACLAEEFSSIHVLNLRGNARTSGVLRRSEGDNVFGQGSRAPVSITILVRNPEAAHDGCRIRYRDIGDYLKREEKLTILREAGSIAGIEDWRTITPDQHHDWIGQRDETFQRFFPMGSKAAKAGKTDEVIFRLFSNGYKTSRDSHTSTTLRVMPVRRMPTLWWTTISVPRGSWRNSRMVYPRTRSRTRSQTVILRMFGGIGNSGTT